MKRIVMIFAIAALLVGTIAMAAWAAPGTGAGNLGNGKHGGFFRNLNLTLEQQQKMLEIRQNFQRETLSWRNDLRKQRVELRQLWAANSLNQSAIDAKTKQINAIRVQLVNRMRASREKMRGVLTAEQLKQLQDFSQHRKAGFGNRFKHAGGCRGGRFN